MQLQARPRGLPSVPTKLLKCLFPPEETQTDANFCKHFRNESGGLASQRCSVADRKMSN